MHRVPLLVLAAVFAVPPPAAAADCAPADLQTVAITKQDAAVPADGGIIVVSTAGGMRNSPKNSEAVRPTWKLRAGSASSAPKIDVYAPGLAVYRLGAVKGAAELLDDDGKAVVKVTPDAAKAATLAAPNVKKIEYLATTMRRSWQRIEVTLDAAPPAGTYAIVIADAKGKGLSWSVTNAASTQQFPYSHNDCGVVPNGTVVPKPGETVTVFFVDGAGRRSAASKPLKLGGKLLPGQ
jgi:hypothetical protein